MLKFPELFDKHADAVWYIEITDKAEYWCLLFFNFGSLVPPDFSGYVDVTKFLCDDQGMGVYLYSQLLSGKSMNQMELAEQCFGVTSGEMDAETRKVSRLSPFSWRETFIRICF